jgi:AcrR family transcriptional regulator
MPRPPVSTKGAARKRRTAEESRTAILDAAERRLVASGPGGIRLQEVAADVGVSHPTVLHHFGSREGLVEAVVARALDSLHAGLMGAVRVAPKGPDAVAKMLDSVSEALETGGHARAFLWLALAGYEPTMAQLHVRSLAEAVHEARSAYFRGKKRRPPPFEDTYFTMLLPAFALLSLSVTENKGDKRDDSCGAPRFRAWLARLIHHHLEEG